MDCDHEYVATTAATTVQEPLVCRRCFKPHWCLTNVWPSPVDRPTP